MMGAPDLLPYQVRAIERARSCGLSFIVHARRVGITWALASLATESDAAGDRVAYIAPSSEAAAEFKDVAASMGAPWSRVIAVGAETLWPSSWSPEAEAFWSQPRKLLIVDQAAWVDRKVLNRAVIQAAWGVKVVLASTISREPKNRFSELLATSTENKLVVTFDDALADGLFERIQALAPKIAGPKEAWAANLRRLYGVDAAQELGCIVPEATA